MDEREGGSEGDCGPLCWRAEDDGRLNDFQKVYMVHPVRPS